MKGFAVPALLAVSGAVMLAGCSIGWPVSDSAPVAPTRWVCDSQVEVSWQYTSAARHAVDVRLNSAEQVYHLQAEPGADGQFYSDNVLAFRIKDGQGLVYWVATNDLIGRGCKAP